MDQGRGRLRGVAVSTVSALVAVVVLAGCTAEGRAAPGAESGNSSPSASTSVEPSPVEASDTAAESPPAPEVPKARKGPGGQKAFARYVMAAWAWSLRANDAGPLLDVSPSRKQPCRGCRPLEKELAQRAKEGWYVDFPGLTVESTKVRRGGTDVVAASKVDIPESDSYLDDGSYRSTSPAHPGATFTVRMRWTKDGYRLVSFTIA